MTTRRTILKWTAAAGLTAVLAPTASAVEDDAIGEVNDVLNFAWGTPPGEARDEIEYQDPAFMEELIETGDESAIVIVFADGSKLTLGENSQATIDEFVYDPAAKTGNQVIKLTKGAFRYVSGALPKENVKIETPPATLGICGTELVIDISDEGEVEASTESGEAIWTGSDGEISEVAQGSSLIIGRNGRRRGPIRRLIHRSRSLAIAEGLVGARKRWRIRKERRRRVVRKIRKIRTNFHTPLRPLHNKPGPNR